MSSYDAFHSDNHGNSLFMEDESTDILGTLNNNTVATENYDDYYDFLNNQEQASPLNGQNLELFDTPVSKYLESIVDTDEIECITMMFKKLNQNEYEKLYSAIDMKLWEDLKTSINLLVPRNHTNNLYHFDRNKDYHFRTNYNIPDGFTNKVFLKITIAPLQDKNVVQRSAKCDIPKHNEFILFSVNDIAVYSNYTDAIPLNKDAKVLLLTLKFFCNSGCATMWKRSKLIFSFYSASGIFKQFEYNLKVSERSNRDERICRERLPVTVEEMSFSPMEPTETFMESNDHKKDYPKLHNYDSNLMPFEVNFGKNKKSKGSEFFANNNEKVNFVIHAPNNPGNLLLKITNVDRTVPTKVFVCCDNPKHKELAPDANKIHTIKCDAYGTKYIGHDWGTYQDDRLSLEIPLREESTNIGLNFPCYNTCFYRNKKASIALVFTLESPEGTLLGRRVFDYKITQRPSRSTFKDGSGSESEQGSPRAPKRKCSTDSSDDSQPQSIKLFYTGNFR